MRAHCMRFCCLTRIAVACIAGFFALTSYAVTDKEMEQARTIATQAYLRYANDGSGYLDDLHPTTMAELQKVLKTKEKENIKAFQGVAVPKDYASWDKAKLVEYWSVTAFKAPGLTDKGRAGKNRARARIQAMNVSAPSPAKSADTKSAAASEESREGKTAESVVAQDETPVIENMEGGPGTQVLSKTDSARAAAAAEMEAVNEEIARTAEAEAALEDVSVPKKDNTWLYIVILCVLVAVVVALVIFASNTMKRRGNREDTPEERDRHMREREAERAAAREVSAAADTLRAENDALKKELEDARTEAMRWRTETTALRERVRALEDTLESLTKVTAVEGAAEPAVSSHVSTVKEPAVKAAPVADSTGPQNMNKIYLGRVNARGLFVRADRGLNPEGSVYVLETEDGFSGSFRVVRNREVWKRLLSNPEHWLAGGCIIRDPEDVDPTAIVTESVGTAVFEDSCWRVIRKARIRLE